jgi:hypothetical protein
MKCELCGREYIALGVHIRRKHHIDPDDYREEFGILRTTPLVDQDLSEHLSASAKRRMSDDDYKAEVQARCLNNAANNRGRPSAGMSRAGRQALARRNSEANEAYLRSCAPEIARVLSEKKTLVDVRKALGTSSTAAKKMALLAGLEYSAEAGRSEQKRRAAATHRAKAMQRVAKVMAYFDKSKSAAEMCRLGGISIKTYKNWVRAGLIQRHPNGTGPRSIK